MEVDTGKALTFTYGYTEIRARNPRKGRGIIPAFWMNSRSLGRKPFTKENPLLEIDGYEIFGKTNALAFTVHEWYYENGESIHHQHAVGRYQLPHDRDFYDDFYIFGVDWTQDYIAFYLDGTECCRVDITAPLFNFCHEPLCIILSNQIGLTSFSEPDAETPWPADYEIDWAHYYRRKESRILSHDEFPVKV